MGELQTVLPRREIAGVATALLGAPPFASGAVVADAAVEEEEEQDPERRVVTSPFTFPACAQGTCEEIQGMLTRPAVRLAGQRFPLLVFTGGFATDASQYGGLAEAVALSGCAVLRYDAPGANAATDDALVRVVRSVLDYASSSDDIRRLVKIGKVILVGHSRGAKVSSLAAAVDERVRGLCLLDPIDNTVWAPVSPGFPSACEALRGLRPSRPLPVAIVGAGTGGDCAPVEANYQKFFEAARKPAWLLVIPAAGHAQFLDSAGAGALQRAICGSGEVEDAAVQAVAAAVCLAWAGLVCGPVAPVGKVSSVERVGRRAVEETAARAEIARQVTNLTLPKGRTKARELAMAVSVAAKTTADGLRQAGVAVESSLKV